MKQAQEFEAEWRRREYLKMLEEYLTEEEQRKISHKNKKKRKKRVDRKRGAETTEVSHGQNREPQNGVKNGSLNKEKIIKNKDERKKITNLSEKEQKGLLSLKERIKEGEIIVTNTDKSGRLAVLRKDQYLASGKEHTKKDKNNVHLHHVHHD